MPSVELTAIAELDPALRDEASKRVPSAAAYADFRELLAEAQVEAVVIALPNPLHVPAAVAAFERGLHVYLEKPLGLSLAEGREAVRAWHNSGRVGMIGYNYRFGPMQIEARRLIAEGRIGKVVAMQSVFASAARDLPPWKQRRKTGGGALLDLASHHLDLSAWLLDADPIAIACSVRSLHSEDDTAMLQLEFENGPTAQIMASIAAVENDRFEISGDAGRIVFDRYRSDKIEIHPPSLERVRMLRAGYAFRDLASFSYWRGKFTDAGPEVSYWKALEAFVDAALAGRQVSPNLDAGYRGLEIIEAAERSAREGRKVEFRAQKYEDSAR
jgi:predicted dehydrogenase